MRASPSAPGRLRRALRAIGAGVGLTAVFALSAATGALLHLNTPVARRVAQGALNNALAPAFLGTLTLGEVERISLRGEVDVSSALVLDPEGAPVLRVQGLRVRADALALVKNALIGGGGARVDLALVHVDDVDVLLEPSSDGSLGIARAFSSRPSKKPPSQKKSSAKAPQTTVDIGRIEIDHASIHGAVAPPRALDAEVDALRGALHTGPDGLSIDIESTRLVERALLPATAAVTVSCHLRQTSPPPGSAEGSPPTPPVTTMWGDVAGRLGAIDATASVRLDGDHVEASLDVPRVTPEAAAALSPGAPLRRALSAKARIHGDLPDLRVEASVRVDGKGGPSSEPASLEIEGDLRTGAALRLRAQADVRRADPSAFGDALPEAQVSGLASAAIELGDRARAVAFAHVDPLDLMGQRVPAIELHAAVDGDKVSGTIDVDEPGAPLSGAFAMIAGGVRFDASTRIAALRGVTRLNAPIDGRADVAVSGELKDGALDASVRATIGGLQAPGDVELGAARATARVRGPLKALTLAAQVQGRDLRAGRYSFSSFSATAAGPVTAPSIRSTFHGEGGELLRLGATVDAQDRGARRVEVHAESHGQTLDARAARVSAKGGAITLEGISAQGDAIEGLSGSLVIRDSDVTGKLHAEDIDVERLLKIAGQPPRGRGVASIDVDIKKTASGRKGYMSVALEDGEASIVSGVSSMINLRFDEQRATADGFVRLIKKKPAEGEGDGACCGGEIAEVRVSGSSDNFRGPLLAASTWSKLDGSAEIAADELNIACIADLAPGIFAVLPISEAAGRLSARATIAREAGQRLASIRDFSLRSRGLRVVGKPRDGDDEPAWASRSIDVRVGGSFDAATGAASADVALDQRGTLIELRATTTLDVAELIDHPSERAKLLRAAPIAGTLSIPRRSLASLSTLPGLKPGAIQASGDVSVDAFFAGAAASPNLVVRAMAWSLVPKGSGAQSDDVGAWAPPVDLDALLTYDGARATLEAHAKADQRELVTAGATLTAKIEDIVAGKALDPTQKAWTASAHAELRDAPLSELPFLARRGVSGVASGSIAIQGLNTAPSIALDVSVRDLKLGEGPAFLGARASLHVDPSAAGAASPFPSPNLGVARLELTARDGGQLTLIGYSGVQWAGGLVPSPDRDAPADLYLSARRLRIQPIEPFASPVLSRVDGHLDGELRVGWRRVSDEKNPKIEADIALNDGVFHVPKLGQELQGAHMRIIATPAGVIRFDDIGAKALSGSVKGWALARMNGLQLEHAAAELEIPEADPLPFSVEGVPLGTVHGKTSMTAASTGEQMNIAIRVPHIHVELPTSIGRRTQPLDENPDITLLQPLGPKAREAASGAPTDVKLTVALDDATVQSSMMRLKIATRAGAPVHVDVTDRPRISGDVELPSGQFTVIGKRFELERGLVHMNGQDDPNPYLNATARWDAPDGSHVYVDYVGTLSPITEEKITFRSDPPRTKQEIIATLLLGSEYEHGTVAGGATSPTQEDGPRRSTTNAASGLAAGFISGQLSRFFEDAGFKTSIGTTEAGAVKTALAYERDGTRAQITYEGSSASSGTRTPTGGSTEVSIDWRFQKNWLLRGMVRVGSDQPSSGLDLLWQYRY